MANNGVTKKDWINALSFWAIAISAVVFLVTGILGVAQSGVGETIMKVLTLIAEIFIFLAIIAPAWRYAVQRKHIVWKILAIVFMVLYVVGIILVIAA